jgi:hypothetical protein
MTERNIDIDNIDYDAIRREVEAKMTPEELQHNKAMWQATLKFIGGSDDAE